MITYNYLFQLRIVLFQHVAQRYRYFIYNKISPFNPLFRKPNSNTDKFGNVYIMNEIMNSSNGVK